MAIPTDYIFTSGTCRKDGIYNLIINTLKAAGWTDVSSLASSDFVVLKSTGVNADKNLVINLRAVNASATNNVTSTQYCQMSYRLVDSYTPGAAGVAGTFGRSSLAWTDLYIVPGAASCTMAVDAIINYKVYCDAGKLILSLEYPGATGYSPMVIYIGQVDSSYVSESNSSGMVVAVSATAAVAASVQIDNSADGAGAVSAPYALATQSLLPSTNPNAANKYAYSDIYFGNATEGIRGKLDGLLCIKNSNVLTGDNVIDGTKTYYVLVCQTQGNTSFPSQALLVRIV